MPTATIPQKIDLNHRDVLDRISKLKEELKATSIQDIYNNYLIQIEEGTAPSLEVLVNVKTDSFRFVEFDNESKTLFKASFQCFSYTMDGVSIEFYDEMPIVLKNPLVSDLAILEEAIPLLSAIAINGVKTPVSILQELATLLK